MRQPNIQSRYFTRCFFEGVGNALFVAGERPAYSRWLTKYKEDSTVEESLREDSEKIGADFYSVIASNEQQEPKPEEQG